MLGVRCVAKETITPSVVKNTTVPTVLTLVVLFTAPIEV